MSRGPQSECAHGIGMKAAALREIGKPFVIEQVPRSEIGPDEVLIKTRTCGICRTDIHVQDGSAYVPVRPHICTILE